MRKWLIGTVVAAVLLGGGWQPVAQETKYGYLPVTAGAEEAPVLPVQARAGTAITSANDLHLLARVVAAEAGGEPFEGQVAVAAVLLNRVKHPSFPNSIAGVVYQPLAFESVMSGHIWRVTDLATAERAARAALSGWDPTYGALYFWNPSKPVSRWIWTRKIIRTIGDHVFGI